METIQAVKCIVCKGIHEISSNDYVVVSGEITQGTDKVLFNSEQKIVFCKECFFKHFREIITGTVYR